MYPTVTGCKMVISIPRGALGHQTTFAIRSFPLLFPVYFIRYISEKQNHLI